MTLLGQPDDEDGSTECVFRVAAKCHHSMRKSETPHALELFITSTRPSSYVHHCTCSCAIGNSGCCGHVIGLLYQLADYKARNLKCVPDPVPSTSLPQQWHKPRGKKIGAIRVEDMQLSAPSSRDKLKVISSTLYSPVSCTLLPDFAELKSTLAEISPACQWMTMDSSMIKLKTTKFGSSVMGSILSYQQSEHPSYLYSFPGIDYPRLPVTNTMCPLILVKTEQQILKVEELSVTSEQCVSFELQTRLQADSDLWMNLRRSRMTASKIGGICKRRTGHYNFFLFHTVQGLALGMLTYADFEKLFAITCLGFPSSCYENIFYTIQSVSK